MIEGDDFSKEAIEVGLGDSEDIEGGGGESYSAIKGGIIEEED